MLLFLDSTTLIGWRLNINAIKSRELREIARDARCPIYVSELVIKESSRQQAYDINRTFKEAREIAGELARHIKDLSLPAEKSEDVLSGELEEVLRRQLIESGIEIIPQVTDSVLKFAEKVVRDINRTKKKTIDLGLRDSLILCSVAEHLKSKPGNEALFVTGDERLGREDVRRVLNGLGQTKLLVCTLDEAKAKVSEHLSKQEKIRRAALEQKIRAFLDTQKDKLEELVRKTPLFTADQFRFGFFASLKEVVRYLDVHLGDILSVSWVFDSQGSKDNVERFQISCEVNVLVDLEVAVTAPAPKKKLKAGEAIPSWLASTALTFDQPEPERQVERKGYMVIIEGTLLSKGGEFVALENLTVTEKPSLASAIYSQLQS